MTIISYMNQFISLYLTNQFIFEFAVVILLMFIFFKYITPLLGSTWSRVCGPILISIAEKKNNMLFSILGAILLSVPFRQLMILLNIWYLYPIIAGFYSCMLISVIYMYRGQNTPKIWIFLSKPCTP